MDAQNADSKRHSHGKNVSHQHARGDEEHSHTGRRAHDGSIVWMTFWPDGSEEVRTLNNASTGGAER